MKNLFKGKKAFLTIPFLALLFLFIIGSLTGSNPPNKDQPTHKAITPESKVEGVQAKTTEPTTPPAIAQARAEAKLLKVIDGDTLSVSLNGKTETIRIIGIDTHETVDPRKPVQCFGQEASRHAKLYFEDTDRKVWLEADPTQGDRDKYQRLLRYVFTDDDTVDFGKVMILLGYASEYTYDLPYKYQTIYKQAEKEAREGKKGLWADDACPITPTKTPDANTGTPGSTYSGGDKDCGDFATHAEAQSFFISQGGPGSDPHKLDADHDGQACETLP